MAFRSDILVARCRADAELRDPVHPGRHPTDEQTIAQPCVGSSFGTCKQAAFTLGDSPRGENLDRYLGSNALFVFVGLRSCFRNIDAVSTQTGNADQRLDDERILNRKVNRANVNVEADYGGIHSS